MAKKLVSIISPVYNEAEGIGWFHKELTSQLSSLDNYAFEIVYVNDGSSDNSLSVLKDLEATDHTEITIIDLSRNFGKEAALSAGISSAKGAAVLSLDSDGQHPVECIAEFISKWEAGGEVIVGIRKSNKDEGFVKHHGSRIFYPAFNKLTGIDLIPGSTDFRLLDRKVVDEFKQLKESGRITRGLIDWLGYRREYVEFHAKARQFGDAGYTFKKLTQLAINTFVSLSAVPLFVAGYIGLFFLGLSLLTGIFILIEQIILNDPMSLHITGTAMLGLLTLFLVGVILAAQGLVGVYTARILAEAQGRPLFVIREITMRNKKSKD